MSKLILIAGGHGQVGSEFAALSTDQIRCLSLGSSELNICQANSIETALDTHRPDALINAAAYTAVDKAETETDAAYALNRDGAEQLALACSARDIPLLHLSTDYVFNGKKKHAYVESDPTDPQGVYGESKLAGELAIQKNCRKYLILRVSWVFGQFGNNFVKTMLRLAANRDELGVVADQHGAPTSANSIARTLLNLAVSSLGQAEFPWGLYHLPSHPATNWHEFAEEIFAQANSIGLLSNTPKVNAIATEDYPTPAARPANSAMGSNKPLTGITACDWKKELNDVLVAIKNQDQNASGQS
ncbi:MAG: dTDP-4-dehydrorhamnose reductase [Pseudomonadales bacterium]